MPQSMTDPTDLLRAEPIKMAAPQKGERTIFTAAPAGPEDGMEFVVIITKGVLSAVIAQ